jgi:hypothetical protein
VLVIAATGTTWNAMSPAIAQRDAMLHADALALIAAITWLATACVEGLLEIVALLNPSDIEDNLHARRVRTQARVLGRTLKTFILLIGLSAALITFPSIRQFGTTLLASAGVAGLVAGLAARPILGNVFAGIQIAITQPIRIDDVLIGEWGRVEEITGAYVVVRIWDERRLIVPLQWFIDHPFQNWTRTSAQILGSVFFWADYALPVEAVRAEFLRLCKAAPEWDGRVAVMQVTDFNERAMQLRGLASSVDAGRNWDLRCRLREGLIAFIAREYPRCLPRLRADTTEGGSAAESQTTAVVGPNPASAAQAGGAPGLEPRNAPQAKAP